MLDWKTIDGWLRADEGAELQRLATGRHVLEIGSLFGRSTICMAPVASHVVSVDPHTAQTFGGKWHGIDSYPILKANLAVARVIDRVTVLRAKIEDVEASLVPDYDLIFIDGDHSYAACLRDLQIAERLLIRPGVIAVHDYQAAEKHLADVTRAVDAWRGDRPVRKVHTLAVFELS